MKQLIAELDGLAEDMGRDGATGVNAVASASQQLARLERENAALADALASAEIGLKHALMMEPGDPFKRVQAITAALDAVRAARKEAQP